MMRYVFCCLAAWALVVTTVGRATAVAGLSPTSAQWAKQYWHYSVESRVVDGQETAERVGYHFMTPLMERLAGVSHIGNAARLRLALERARNGEPLSVAALGGSITMGQGARHDEPWAVLFTQWLNLALPPNGSALAAQRHRTLQRGRRLERRTRRRRELLQAQQHTYTSGAVPGTVSAYMSSCLQHHLPPRPDLVFLEYAANDPPEPSQDWDDSQRRAFERLVRKVLRLPSRPAVVLVHMYAHEAAGGRFWRNAERDFSELALYYGLPSVSLKAAVVPAALSGSLPQLALDAVWNGGVHHPGQGGHVVVAELLITLALEVLHANHRLALAVGRAGHAGGGPQLPPPAPPGSRREGSGRPSAAAGGGADAAGAVAVLEAAAFRELPPPMVPGNWEAGHSTCYLRGELKGLVLLPAAGWSWTDEGRGKWGWVAQEAGRELRVKLSTELPAAPGRKRKQQATTILQVGYLQSYSGMGAAGLSCESGCTCKAATVDAFDAARQVSVTVMRDIRVSQHPECVLLVRTTGPAAGAAAEELPEWASRGAKWKLMGVVVGEDPEASKGGIGWVREETLDARG